MASKSSDMEAVRRRLEEMREEILSQSASTAADRAPVELDQQSIGRLSRMDAMQGQAMARSQESRRRALVARIDAALKRVEQGEYGFCVKCGEDIAPKRLEADPTVPRCVECSD